MLIVFIHLAKFLNRQWQILYVKKHLGVLAYPLYFFLCSSTAVFLHVKILGGTILEKYGLELNDLLGSLQPKPFYGSMILWLLLNWEHLCSCTLRLSRFQPCFVIFICSEMPNRKSWGFCRWQLWLLRLKHESKAEESWIIKNMFRKLRNFYLYSN